MNKKRIINYMLFIISFIISVILGTIFNNIVIASTPIILFWLAVSYNTISMISNS